MPNKPRARYFLAVDGEGLTRTNGAHDYVLLAASDRTAVEDWTRGGLSTRRCFDYLLDLSKRHYRAILVAFSFGYDVNMMLRDITREELVRVNDSEYTVIGDRYIVRYTPGKAFYVGRGHWDNRKWVTEQGVTVWDVWGFFQSSFVNALAEWEIASPETVDIIARMKEKRGEFDDDMRALITSYCFRECELLAKLMDAFQRVVDGARIKLSRYDGAGALAGALLRSHGMKAIIEPSRRTPIDAERAALYAYFGGRIEIYGSGVINEPCFEYDINSAYPAEISQLPSMHGVWTHEAAPLKFGNGAHLWPWSIIHVRWSMPEGTLICPFPWRDRDGAVLYPLQGEGWYHAPEVLAALELYPRGTVEMIEAWVFHPAEPNTKPFAWVSDLYTLRQEYKRTKDARHIVLKLALNAGYGKLAQSIGFKRNEPPAYQSFYLAGRVTSGTRAKILRALHEAGPRNVISAMTDALFVRKPLALPLSTTLGQWSETMLKPGLLVVQPGVVLSPESECGVCNGAGCFRCKDGRSMSFGRSRGFYRSSLNYDAALRAWRSHGLFGGFRVLERRFIGMGRALASARLAEWNINEPERDILGNLISEQWRRWVEISKVISFRANMERKQSGGDAGGDWITWFPYEGKQKLGAMYRPKTVYRDVRAIREHDACEQVDASESMTL